MASLEQTIMAILNEQKAPHEVIEHEAVYTNPTMAEKLGVPVADTVKNLMLETAEGKVIQVVLPGDKRFDARKVAEAASTRRVTFAKPETVLEVAGCEVGCVPPFGHLKPVQVYMDRSLLWKKQVYFNPGVHTRSVKIEARWLKQLCKPVMI